MTQPDFATRAALCSLSLAGRIRGGGFPDDATSHNDTSTAIGQVLSLPLVALTQRTRQQRSSELALLLRPSVNISRVRTALSSSEGRDRVPEGRIDSQRLVYDDAAPRSLTVNVRLETTKRA